MASPNIKPRQEQDVPDDALSIKNMLEGKVLEYRADFLKQGKNPKEAKKEFDGFFKSLLERAEIAKALVLIDGYENFLKSIPSTPEQELISQIDGILAKMDVEKTNLPSIPPREDSFSHLSEAEKENEEDENN